MKILVLNSGSSSQKNSLYDVGQSTPASPPVPAWEGKIEWGGSNAEVQIQNSKGLHLKDQIQVVSRRQATELLLKHLWSGQAPIVGDPSEIDIVGHRIVNGGKEYEEPAFITPQLKAAIQRMSVFAPLHNRAELEGIEIIEQTFGSVPQVAVFDTG